MLWGLPRDPNASPHLTAMVVSAVATVLLVRGALAILGYPQIGGRGLHIAHVLWGGLFMIGAVVMLVSFAGPVIRPAAAVVAGVGIGLFIDEVGKFVTSDSDYFYRPAAAIMYAVLVALVLVIRWLHGRRPHHPNEHLAGAVDQAVAGVVGGFTPLRRTEVETQLRRARGATGHAEVTALVRAVPDDPHEFFDPVRLVVFARLGRLRRRLTHRLVASRFILAVTIAALLIELAYALDRFGPRLYRLVFDESAALAGPPGPVALALGIGSTLVFAVFVLVGTARVIRERVAGFAWFHRAVLVNLLVTRMFDFDVNQFAAAGAVLVDLAVLGVITTELTRLRRRRTPPQTAAPTGSTGLPAGGTAAPASSTVAPAGGTAAPARGTAAPAGSPITTPGAPTGT